MRVFEGGQPGYAILVFDQSVESPSLKLAVRSLQVAQGAWLGPSGAFERVPHYFSAVRVTAPKGGFGYQVGPEIVNFLKDDDQIEISAQTSDDENALVETGYWANATPLMGSRGPTALLAGAPPPSLVSQPMGREAPPSEQNSSGLVAESPDADKTAANQKPAGPDEKKPDIDPPPAPGRRPWWVLVVLALILAAAGAALALALSPSLRCSVLARDCAPPPTPPPTPPPVEPEDAAAASRARACDSRKTAANLVCEEETACFEPYRRRFPQGPARPELESLAARAAAACSAAETQAYSQAQQCAASAAPCIAPTCYVDYNQKYANGAHAQGVRDDLARAKAICEKPAPAPGPDERRRSGQPPLKDGEYLATASEATACGVARQRAIHVFVCSGRVRWVHEGRLFANMPSVPLQWDGAVDDAGAVTASVSGNAQLVAKGSITDTERAIEMQYPNCNGTIELTITRQLAAGCSGR